MEATKIDTYDVKETFKQFEGMAKAMLDAWAVVDAEGKVVKSNALFQQVTGMKGKAIIKADSFDECLKLQYEGSPYSIKDLLKTTTPTRLDEVGGSSSAFEELILLLGYYPFMGDTDVPYGAFILIRDVTAEAGLQGKFKEKSKLSITDKLTGLYNRAHFETVMPKLIEMAKEAEDGTNDKNLTVIMFDIDKFKSVNDTYGHQAGDLIIAQVAKIMADNFRKSDIVCRYGGEEFLVILPGCDTEAAAKSAEKVRDAVQKGTYVWEGTEIPNSISAGVAQINLDTEDGEKVIARADLGLYEAKETGRNRVIIHTPEGMTTFTKEEDILVNVMLTRG